MWESLLHPSIIDQTHPPFPPDHTIGNLTFCWIPQLWGPRVIVANTVLLLHRSDGIGLDHTVSKELVMGEQLLCPPTGNICLA